MSMGIQGKEAVTFEDFVLEQETKDPNRSRYNIDRIVQAINRSPMAKKIQDRIFQELQQCQRLLNQWKEKVKKKEDVLKRLMTDLKKQEDINKMIVQNDYVNMAKDLKHSLRKENRTLKNIMSQRETLRYMVKTRLHDLTIRKHPFHKHKALLLEVEKFIDVKHQEIIQHSEMLVAIMEEFK